MGNEEKINVAFQFIEAKEKAFFFYSATSQAVGRLYPPFIDARLRGTIRLASLAACSFQTNWNQAFRA